jgi:large subunit ribosomal protein L29
MKTKNWITTKSLSEPELNAKLTEMEDKLFTMKFHNATSPIKNPLAIRELRKDVARLKTLLREKRAIK